MTMKHFLLTAALLATFSTQAQNLPSASPKGSVSQVVGLTNITVTYNRPSARERRIFGDLVPYGMVWRTGANLCTIIELDGPIMVEGQKLAEGKYSIFTIPGEVAWQVIFNKNTELWGEGDRKEEEDVLTVKVMATEMKQPVETFTIGFGEVKDDKATLDLSWEHMRVSVGLFADATEKAMTNIKEAIGSEKADFRTYHNSARFLIDRNMMPEQALTWAQQSVKMDTRFWNVYTLALACHANGKTKDAIVHAEECKKLAREANYEAYVKMADERLKEWGGTARPVTREMMQPAR